MAYGRYDFHLAKQESDGFEKAGYAMGLSQGRADSNVARGVDDWGVMDVLGAPVTGLRYAFNKGQEYFAEREAQANQAAADAYNPVIEGAQSRIDNINSELSQLGWQRAQAHDLEMLAWAPSPVQAEGAGDPHAPGGDREASWPAAEPPQSAPSMDRSPEYTRSESLRTSGPASTPQIDTERPRTVEEYNAKEAELQAAKRQAETDLETAKLNKETEESKVRLARTEAETQAREAQDALGNNNILNRSNPAEQARKERMRAMAKDGSRRAEYAYEMSERLADYGWSEAATQWKLYGDKLTADLEAKALTQMGHEATMLKNQRQDWQNKWNRLQLNSQNALNDATRLVAAGQTWGNPGPRQKFQQALSEAMQANQVREAAIKSGDKTFASFDPKSIFAAGPNGDTMFTPLANGNIKLSGPLFAGEISVQDALDMNDWQPEQRQTLDKILDEQAPVKGTAPADWLKIQKAMNEAHPEMKFTATMAKAAAKARNDIIGQSSDNRTAAQARYQSSETFTDTRTSEVLKLSGMQDVMDNAEKTGRTSRYGTFRSSPDISFRQAIRTGPANPGAATTETELAVFNKYPDIKSRVRGAITSAFQIGSDQDVERYELLFNAEAAAANEMNKRDMEERIQRLEEDKDNTMGTPEAKKNAISVFRQRMRALEQPMIAFGTPDGNKNTEPFPYFKREGEEYWTGNDGKKYKKAGKYSSVKYGHPYKMELVEEKPKTGSGGGKGGAKGPKKPTSAPPTGMEWKLIDGKWRPREIGG